MASGFATQTQRTHIRMIAISRHQAHFASKKQEVGFQNMLKYILIYQYAIPLLWFYT